VIFGIVFLSSMSLGSGMYSTNQIFVFAQVNEAEIRVDTKQESKCENEDCENEIETNNQTDVPSIIPFNAYDSLNAGQLFTADENIENTDTNPIDEGCALSFTSKPYGPWPNAEQLSDFENEMASGLIFINDARIGSIKDLCGFLTGQTEPLSYEGIQNILDEYLSGSSLNDVLNRLVDTGLVMVP